jgi:hypothetical protein
MRGRHFMNRHPRLTLGAATLLCFAYACASKDTGEVDPGLTGGSGGSGGVGIDRPGETGGTDQGAEAGASTGGSTSETGGSTGTGGTGSVPIVVGVGGSAGQAPVTEDASCGVGMATANLKPVNMLVMFDRSSSMLDCTDGTTGDEPCATQTRWQSATSALNTFFQSPEADGLGVALRFFPHDVPAAGCFGAEGGACNATACSEALVDMDRLTAGPAPTDSHEQALLDAVASSTPIRAVSGVNTGGTPISAALEGGHLFTTAHQAAHPDERTVLVFVTDGKPNGCDQDFADISKIASDALASSGVPTYVIGLTDSMGGGVNQDDMNDLADAGGTTQAFFVSDSATAATDLLDTLNAIRGDAIACDFPLPSSTTSGMTIDPTLINVSYTSANGGETELGLVASAADCASEQAWYYDDPAAPMRIILCPSACETVTSDSSAAIRILAGCQPRIVVPK